MKDYTYSLKVRALLEKEATEKVEALAVLASNLTAIELKKLAHIVQNDPIKTAMAKKYLGV